MKVKPTTWILLFAFLLPGSLVLKGQDSSKEDARFIKRIHDQILRDGNCYNWLYHLSEEIGGRMSGSAASYKAIDYTRQLLDEMSDTSYLQPCMVTNWKRGKEAQAAIRSAGSSTFQPISVTSLGNSVATSPVGVLAELVEVMHLDSLKARKVKDKIVFWNRPLDPTQIRTFNAYGRAVDQRFYGPHRAMSYGAVASMNRSMTTLTDDQPHTGSTDYNKEGDNIPAVAVSNIDAERISELLKKGKVEMHLTTYGENRPDTLAHNVIAEIRGSEFPDEIILVGGHLDSWDLGGGAHDDGAGCVHAIQVFETLKALNYKPKRTLRCVMFMNEENGQGGAIAYRDSSDARGEHHMAALESDAGGFTPRGFSFDAHAEIFNQKYRKVSSWLPLLEPYKLSFEKGGSGADISRLKGQRGLLIGFRPDSQRYFDFHHTRVDRIDAVNERELKLGAAAITSLIYLIDKYGLNE